MFEPTEEQQAVVAAARRTSDNLLVSALAGAAKTSTLVLVAEALKSSPMLCLAFNKRIQLEMEKRLPGNCTSMTLNSLGHRVWGRAVGKRLVLDTKKNYTLLKNFVEELPKRDREDAYNSFADILQAVAFGKTCGYVPTKRFEQARPLMDDDAFFAHLEEAPTRLEEDLIRAVSLESIRRGFQGQIDFDDQILLPTVFPSNFAAFTFPVVLIDEAQDLSALNHVMLSKIARKRLIAVGDECQSIYGFRGAHQESMALLEDQFRMTRLLLSISFRCPRLVVEEARWRAPHMRFPDWAEEGSVMRLSEWSVDGLPETAAIICRNNAPLFSLAFKLLGQGRYPEIVGNDIGKSLIKTLTKLGESVMKRDAVLQAISVWEEEKKQKSRNPTKVADQAECLRIFARQGETLADALAYAEYVMNAKGPIMLMTGHKSKGLEFDTVYILDAHLVRTEYEQQEQNLLYVMQTRAKKELYYVTSDTLELDDGEL